MSSYTMTLSECIQMWTDGQASSTKDRIEKGRVKLFDFEYPIFNAAYKKVFETHFIRKFYMREIGFETEGLFKFNLETWLIVNMPYFNKLFESELLQYDPLTNTKMNVTNNKKKDQTGKTDGKNSSTVSSTNSGELIDDNFDRQIESNTPDGRLNLTAKDGEGVIEYASSIKENNDNSKKTSTGESSGSSNDTTNVTSSINETEDFIESRIGKAGNESFSKLVNDYRGSLLRVENKIFDEMQELFMLVY